MSNQRRFALIGRGFGSDSFDEAVQDLVGALLIDSAEIDFTYTDATPSLTAALKNASVVFARLQNFDALSVLGRAANSAGVGDEIAAGANDRVLARTSDTLAFQQLTVGMAPDAVWTFAKIQDADALSVLGRASNSAGVLDEIAAGTDHQVLRRNGASIAFGALNLAQAAAITGDLPFANLAQITGPGVLGVAASGTADLAAISAGTNDRVLRQTGSVLNFGQLTAGMFPNTVVPDAALSSNVVLEDADNVFANTAVNRFARTASSTTTPAVRIGNTDATTASYLVSAVSSAPANFFGFLDTGNGVESYWGNAAAFAYIGTRSNTDFGIFTNNTQRVYVENDGSEIQLDATTFDFNGTLALTGAGHVIQSTVDPGLHLQVDGSNVNATFRIENVDAARAQITFLTASTLRTLLGAPGTSNDIITGDAVGDFALRVQSGNILTSVDGGTTVHFQIGSARLTAGVPVRLKGYTVATLPAGTVGDTAYVTDALAPAFLTAVVGGGAVKTPVFYDGTNWVAM